MSGLERRFWKGHRLPTLWASEDCLPDKVVLEREALPTPYPPRWKAEILLFSSLQHNRTFILFESPVPEPLSQLLLLGVGGEEEGSCVFRILTRMPRALH